MRGGEGGELSSEEALTSDLVVTVTPGHEVLFGEGSLQPGPAREPDGCGFRTGQGRRSRCRELTCAQAVLCDDWEQASHGGELAAAAEAGLIGESNVTQLGAVLAGDAPGRASADEATTCSISTGPAIQDLAIAIAAYSRAREFELQTLAL